MARTPAWDELDGMEKAFGRSRGGRWKTILVLLGLIGAATFVLAYYVPLYRAHAALTTQHQALSTKVQAAASALKNTQAELSTTKERRDELERERFQRETAKKSQLAKLELVKASLSTKLEKYASKGQLAVTLADDRLFVSLPENLIFAAQKADVSPRGKSVLCDIAKSTAHNPLRVTSVAADGGGAAPKLGKDFDSIWEFTAARAAGAVRTLEQGCGVASSRLSATASGNVQPDAPSELAQKFPARIDVEIMP